MKTALETFETRLQEIRDAGTWREERIITTPQSAHVDTTARKDVLNLCANNYLGLADHPELIAAAKASYDTWGFGLASVRFICGTQQIHKNLERKIASFVGMDDAILYSSCFDANGGLFETLLTAEDAIISDELNHASIIDGVRLCRAKRYRYRNSDMEDLRTQLAAARKEGCRNIIIATDGVFSMDGYVAKLEEICDLADEFDALTMVDDSHALGFMGEHGRGTPEHCRVSRSSICCVSTPVPIFSPTHWPLQSARPRSVRLSCWKNPPSFVTVFTRMPATSAAGWRSWASIFFPESTP